MAACSCPIGTLIPDKKIYVVTNGEEKTHFVGNRLIVTQPIAHMPMVDLSNNEPDNLVVKRDWLPIPPIKSKIDKRQWTGQMCQKLSEKEYAELEEYMCNLVGHYEHGNIKITPFKNES